MTSKYDRKLLNKLFNAIEEGAVSEVERLLKDNPGKINLAGESDNCTPMTRVLALAAEDNSRYNSLSLSSAKKMLKALVDAGADPNHADRDGALPLFITLNHRNPPLASALLELGADPNKRKKSDVSPLEAVIMDSDSYGSYGFEPYELKLLSVLLKAGADPDARGKDGKNAFDCAGSGDLGDEFRKAVKAARKWLKKNPPVSRPKTVTPVAGPVPSATAKNLEALNRILQARKKVPATLETGAVLSADVSTAAGTGAMARAMSRSIPRSMSDEAVVADMEEVPAASAKIHAEKDGWIVLAPDRVAHETVETALNLKITEIFNFATKQHTLITTDLERNIQSNSQRSFDQMENRELLEKAHTVLLKTGNMKV